MPVAAAVVLVFVCFISIFVAYWIGRDSGERAGFSSQQDALERVTRSNVALKVEIERLRRERDGQADELARFWAGKREYRGYPPVE